MGRSWLFESRPSMGDQAIHAAVHHVPRVIQMCFIPVDSAIQPEIQGSLNGNRKGPNELPYDRVLQGAAHQAPQGFLNCV